MKTLLFVVHRYAPFPGGSEYNVQRLAEDALTRGFDVTILSDTHKGDLNGVKVTHDRSIAFLPWDMIIVHGSCTTQDFIHVHSEEINKISPIYYLIVQPSNNPIALNGMRNAKWLGYGTSFDLEHIKNHGFETKARKFNYGINIKSHGQDGFRKLAGITTKNMILSAGGFWPHKRMNELADAFREANPDDTTLVLLGYDTIHGHPPTQSEFVKCFEIEDASIVYDAMWESDLYVLNSEIEGYGLVLLESMFNFCPWAAKPIAAGYDLGAMNLGAMFSNYNELVHLLKTYKPDHKIKTRGFLHVFKNHMIEHSLNNILSCLKEYE